MGASDGGSEAFERFFVRMPADAGIAFVVIQHLDPDHVTLPGTLARHTQMVVAQASDGMPVERDHIYVIPPSAALTIEGGKLRVHAPVDRPGPRTIIDRFLRSLAEDRKSRAVAVILSGCGSDGTLGLEAVKAEGGITFAQDSSAAYQGMPASARAGGDVDYVLPPERIAAELAEGMVVQKELQNGPQPADQPIVEGVDGAHEDHFPVDPLGARLVIQPLHELFVAHGLGRQRPLNGQWRFAASGRQCHPSPPTWLHARSAS